MILYALLLLFSWTDNARVAVIPKGTVSPKIGPIANKNTASLVMQLYDHRITDPQITISRVENGGTFIYHGPLTGLEVDDALVFKAHDGGFWQRKLNDTIKLAWYGLSAQKTDNAAAINKAVQAAIAKRTAILVFPSGGIYKVATSNYFTVPDDVKLTIDGKNATLLVDGKAAAKSQETYVMAFRSSNSNSQQSSLSIKNLKITAPGIKPQWTNRNYAEHRLVIAIETDNIHHVSVNNCTIKDVCGYGIRLKNFVNATITKITANNVGGHFPIENEHDSFGDALWLGHYDVETARPSRKKTYAKISNCTFRGYNTVTNGGFASRCGITVEGFRSHSNDISVKVDVRNTTVSDYDRNLHVEGISANVTYTNCTLKNFFGIGLVASSPKTVLTYNNTKASGQLKNNLQQEHYGLGGIMQFNSALDVHLTNASRFTFNAPASFRANLFVEDKSVLDMGNSDVFFDHADLHLLSGAAMVNVPGSVTRGFNMYGGTIEFNNASVAGISRGPKGLFHGENINAASINNCRLVNSRLLFNGASGLIERN